MMTKTLRSTLLWGLIMLLVLGFMLGTSPAAQALDEIDVSPYIDDIMGLAGFGQPAQANQDLWHAATVLKYDPDYKVAWEAFHTEAEKLLTEGNGETHILNLEKLILVASAAGYDVTAFPAEAGAANLLDLLETELAAIPSLDSLGTNTLVFALLALDAGQSGGSGYPDQTSLNRADLHTAILAQQISADGGWNWFPASSSDLDLTAMTVTALAPYSGDNAIDTALSEAMDFLHNKQNTSGAFPGWGGEGESCTTSAAVVLAALAMGEDPAGAEWTKGGDSLLEALLACHRGVVLGGFAESAGSNLYNEYTTEQVLRALVAYAAASSATPYYFYQFDLPADLYTAQRNNAPGYDAFDGREPQKGQLSGTSRVWVRVESYDGTLQTKTQVTVDNPASAEDALKEAVGANNVEYNAFNMLHKIKGVEAPANASWMAYKNNLAMNASAAQTAVEDGDSIVFSILDYMVGGYAYFSQEEETVKVNTPLTLTLQNVTFPSTTAEPTAGATLSISPATGWQLSGPTNTTGQAQITFTQTGTYTLTASRVNSNATGTGQDITRPYCQVTVSTTGSSGSGSGTTDDTIKVTLSINNAKESGKTILSSRTVTLEKDASVYDALVQALKDAGKNPPEITGKGTSVYVRAIDGLEEDRKTTNGWKYRVNDGLPGTSPGAYILKGGEKIQWFYGDHLDEGEWLNGLTKTEEDEKTADSSTSTAKPAQLLDSTGQPVSGYTPVTIPTTEKDGTVSATLDEKLTTELLTKTLSAGFAAETALVWLEAPKVAEGQTAPQIKQYSLTVQPAQWLQLKEKQLKIVSPFGTVTLAPVTVAALAKLEQATELRLAAGSLVVGLYSGNNALNLGDLGGSLALEIPYTLGAGETAPYVVAVQQNGSTESILPRSHYTNGYVLVSVAQTGTYEARYNAPSFTDTAGQWMDDVVRYLAARNVISGVGEERFAPQRNVTRGEFITMLMRTLGLTAENPLAIDPFVDAETDAFYFEALLNAKALGLVNGVGDNRFAPNAQISRQDMFVMLYNAMRAANLLTPANSGMDLLKFDDYAAIAPYAENALLTFVQKGLVQGSENKLNPGNAATRAEAAQVLYNMLTDF